MSGYFAAGRLTQEEKENILSQHRHVYDGYRTMQPEVNNQQPLYVQDFAKDKVGAVINNKGVVKGYTNMGINESKETKEVCDECGAMMMEGECSECGWKGEVGAMEESDSNEPSFMDKAIDTAKDVGMFVVSNPEILAALEEDTDEDVCECGGIVREGECSECGWKSEMEEKYETGHLDDIYDEQDLDPNAEFDYVKGASNKTNAFHVKEGADDYIDNFEDPDNEDDGFEDINASEVTDEVKEQGGNAPDFDISNVDDAYNFESNGPMAGGDVYPVYEDTDEDCDECWEKMESAWAEEVEEQDISGVQGIYGDMEPAFDFDSEGPGKAGPYQHSSWGGGSTHEDEDVHWEKDLADDELDLDLTKFNPEDKSWEEITAHTGDDEFGGVDEDIRESLIIQKNKIMEMMNRMKIIK